MTPEEVASKASVSRTQKHEVKHRTRITRRKKKDLELLEITGMLDSARAQEANLRPQRRFSVPQNAKEQNELGNDLMEWADLETSRLIDAFPLSRHVSPAKFYDIADKNPYFAECLQYAEARLGERMETKVMDYPIYIMKALPLYSTKWVQAEEKKLAAAAKTASQQQVVFLPTWKLNENNEVTQSE